MNEIAYTIEDRDHVQKKETPLTLMMYGDYECYFCGRAQLVVKTLQEKLGSDLRFVFRSFPLAQIHARAVHAAYAAEAAALQGRFWEMHNILFANQENLGHEALIGFAKAIGLDIDQFVEDMNSERVALRVREDFLSGVRVGVNGTPTFFINGRRHDGSYEYDALLSALERQLSHTSR